MLDFIKVIEVDENYNKASEDVKRLNDLLIKNQIKLQTPKTSKKIEIRYQTDTYNIMVNSGREL